MTQLGCRWALRVHDICVALHYAIPFVSTTAYEHHVVILSDHRRPMTTM